MRKNVSILSLLFLLGFCQRSNAQNEIDVAQITIKVGGLSTEEKYYGFAEGDKIVFNMTERDGKEVKEVTITEYPNTDKLQFRSVSKVEDKILNVSKKSIYKFTFYNSNISGRVINISIKRIPAKPETNNFNTNVVFRNVIDTTLVAQQKQFLISSDSSIVTVINSNVVVHSAGNSAGPKTLVDFVLPPNTASFAYWIGVGNESQEAFNKDQNKVINSGTKFLMTIDPLAGLLVGALILTKSNVGENVIYSFLPSYEDAVAFNSNQQYMQYKHGDVITDFGTLMPRTGKQYIGLYNDNAIQGISVTVKVTALVVKNVYETRTIQVPLIKNIPTPFNE